MSRTAGAAFSETTVRYEAIPLSQKRNTRKYSTKKDIGILEIGNYVFIRPIGEGNFAKVVLAKHRITGTNTAIKIIDKKSFNPAKLMKLNREVNLMKLLRHPNIVRLYEVIETNSKIFLVMELVQGGELYDYIVSHGRMNEDDARRLFRQLISAVCYCHDLRIIHRDLKAENILLDNNLNIKVADFGFGSLYDPNLELDTFCGSPPYAAPELFNGHNYIGPELDIWSLGVVLYVITTGFLPFNGRTLHEIKESVCKGRYRIPFYLSEGCEKLIKKFLTRNPKHRISLNDVIIDPWINLGYSKPPKFNGDTAINIYKDFDLIEYISKKHKIPIDSIVQGIDNKTYDSNTSVYYILYHQKYSLPENPPPDAISSLALIDRSHCTKIDKGLPSPVTFDMVYEKKPLLTI